MSLESWYPEELERRPIRRDGLTLDVPRGWEARIGRQLETGNGERTFPVLHASTVPLSGPRADYGEASWSAWAVAMSLSRP
jgi:hypothetical protein